MKKLVYSLFLLSIIFIPGKVFAISGSVNLNCTPASAYPGDIVTCTIAGDVSDGSINEFSATTTLSDNLEFVSATVVNDWSGTSNGGIFSLKTSKSQTNIFEIASFTVKIKSDSTTEGKITLNTTKLGDISTPGSVTKTITMSSSNITDTSDPKAVEEDTNTDIKNPETGSNIPFMVLGGGMLVTIIIYEIISKKKKLHKI